MTPFMVKVSILPPDATSNCHPTYNQIDIKFYCNNCTVKAAVERIREHEYYKAFQEKIYTRDYFYYTDSQGNWHHYVEYV